MNPRIPSRVNRALDKLGSEWIASLTVSAAVVALLVVAALGYRVPAGIAGVLLLVVFLVGFHRVREGRLREQVRQRDYDIAAKDAEIARLRVGDPTAPTTQLRHIGDGGELL